MKRIALFVGLAALILAVPATHDVFAAKGGQAKVDICHVNSANTPATRVYNYDYTNSTGTYSYGYTNLYTYTPGRVISVAESAVESHVAHGDSTVIQPLTDYWTKNYIENIEDFDYGYSYSSPYSSYSFAYSSVGTNGDLKNADCWIYSFERLETR